MVLCTQKSLSSAYFKMLEPSVYVFCVTSSYALVLHSRIKCGVSSLRKYPIFFSHSLSSPKALAFLIGRLVLCYTLTHSGFTFNHLSMLGIGLIGLTALPHVFPD